LSNAYVGHCKRHELGRYANRGNGFSDHSLEEFKRQMDLAKAKYPDVRLSKTGKREHRRVRHTN